MCNCARPNLTKAVRVTINTFSIITKTHQGSISELAEWMTSDVLLEGHWHTPHPSCHPFLASSCARLFTFILTLRPNGSVNTIRTTINYTINKQRKLNTYHSYKKIKADTVRSVLCEWTWLDCGLEVMSPVHFVLFTNFSVLIKGLLCDFLKRTCWESQL